MVHKRYIKRGGKVYGPYYYKTIRDKEGKVKNIYLGQDRPKKHGFLKVVQQKKYSFIFITLFVLLFFGLYYANYTGFSIFDELEPIKISELGYSNLSVGERFTVKVYSDISPAAYFTDDTDLFNISKDGVIDFKTTNENRGIHSVAILAKYQDKLEYKILRLRIT